LVPLPLAGEPVRAALRVLPADATLAIEPDGKRPAKQASGT
jgi:hypothetical protein